MMHPVYSKTHRRNIEGNFRFSRCFLQGNFVVRQVSGVCFCFHPGFPYKVAGYPDETEYTNENKTCVIGKKHHTRIVFMQNGNSDKEQTQNQ